MAIMETTTAQEIALMKKDIEMLSEDVRELNKKINNLIIKYPKNVRIRKYRKNSSISF